MKQHRKLWKVYLKLELIQMKIINFPKTSSIHNEHRTTNPTRLIAVNKMKLLNEISTQEIESSLQKYMQELEIAGHEYAEAKSIYENLDDDKKPFIAQLVTIAYGSAVSGTKEASQSAKETWALSTDDYRDFLNGLKSARSEFNKCHVRWILAQKKIECWQTLMANRRSEIKNFRG